MKQHLLITGMSRSGTTLLQNLLSSHYGIDILSQPIPMVYRHLKRDFYEKINHSEDHYVLNHLFNEREYTPRQLNSFLEKKRINEVELRRLIHEMEEWSGQKTVLHDYKKYLLPQTPLSLFTLYKTVLHTYCRTETNEVLGSKEILLEEFIPYFLKYKIKTILIIRDPRDVITSLNEGAGPKYVGKHRPMLFHVRHWRNSVALANTYNQHKNLLWIKYEDLVRQTYQCLQKITNFLGLEQFSNDHFKKGILTRDGNSWAGNSSTKAFSGIDKNNTDKYKEFLDENTIKYVEFMCEPEMLKMKYKLNTNTSDYNPLTFEESYNIEINNLNPRMSTDKYEIDLELARRKLLLNGEVNKQKIFDLFYDEKNFHVLRKSFQ
ncbi:MAG: sulfotransferase [Balneolales bacterium]